MKRLAYSTPGLNRETFVAGVRADTEADGIVKGTYGSVDEPDFRGCCVGCGNHVANAALGTDFEHDDHAALDRAVRWPYGTAALADTLFEGLPAGFHVGFPLRLAEAVQQNADLSTLLNRFKTRVLRELVLPHAGAAAEVVKDVADSYGSRRGAQFRQTARKAARLVGFNDPNSVSPAKFAAYAASKLLASCVVGNAAWCVRLDGGSAVGKAEAYSQMAEILLAECAASPIGKVAA